MHAPCARVCACVHFAVTRTHSGRHVPRVAVTTFLQQPEPDLQVCADVQDGVKEIHSAAMPEWMYDGVVYGISAWNPQQEAQPRDTDVDSVVPPAATNEQLNARLLDELMALWPAPQRILLRHSRTPSGEWSESGFAVRFDTPSIEAERAVLYLARLYGQVRI